MSRALIARIICLSAGARSLRAQFKTEYLAEKALEAAKVIEKQDEPEFVAVLFAALAGNVLNELNPGRVEMFVADAIKILESESFTEMDDCIESIIAKEARERSDALDALKAAEKEADKQPEVKKEEPVIVPQPEPKVVPEAPKVDEVKKEEPQVVQPTVDVETPKVDEPKPPVLSPLIGILPITAKQKASLKAAGLETWDDVIRFEGTNKIESLPDIGPKSAEHILTLVGYKKAE